MQGSPCCVHPLQKAVETRFTHLYMQLDRQFWEKSPSEMVRSWAGTVPTKLLLKTCTYLGQCRQGVVDRKQQA